ncbi:MAG: 1-acyl-sn-glycerol-3-phosphate acyltransferase [Mesorhizobium amorphae]|nr:MAG: 1-acyl-sn-glycerol-3-phosphate acyltransferase [Mesorhizobium amorphae]
MLALRSLLFNALFYLSLIVQMILWSPFYFLAPRKAAWFVPKFWARSSLWLLEHVAGAKSVVEGQENLPQGSYIVASKHQSFWDVLAPLPHIPDALIILKRELTWIPVFGWYVMKMRMVPINRAKRGSALRDAAIRTREEMRVGRQLLIYPEGTRRAPGEEPAYKWGIAELYGQLQLPVVPVAHQAGLFWPRRKFLRHPGTIRARFLPPIPAGLPKEEFMRRLVAETEAACDQALIEVAESPDPPPFPPSALKRLDELRARG